MTGPVGTQTYETHGFVTPSTGETGREIQVVRPAPVERARLDFDDEQMQLIRDSFANGATEQEFRVLMEVAKARRLNPFLRQIHFVKRWNSQLRREVWAAQAAIDGFRSIAEASGKYDGQDEPEYEYDPTLKGPQNPLGLKLCRVRVYRKDWSRPCVGVAHWAEYAQTNREGALTQFWREKGHVMLAKCAESLGMRKAFPEDLAGLYTPEEVGGEPLEEQRQLPPAPRKPGSGAAGPGHNISPHLEPDENPGDFNPSQEGDAVYAAAMTKMHKVKEDIMSCGDIDTALLIRAVLGSKAKSSQLTRELQTARETGLLSPDQRKELGSYWQQLNRMLEHKENELEPGSAGDYLGVGGESDTNGDARQ